MPKQTRRPAPKPRKPSTDAAALLRVAVAIEAQSDALARIEQALAGQRHILERAEGELLDNHEAMQSVAELLRQQISASAPGQAKSQ